MSTKGLDPLAIIMFSWVVNYRTISDDVGNIFF